MKHYGLFGAGGFGREVMPIFCDLISGSENNSEPFFIMDTPEVDEINGHRVISTSDFLNLKGDKYFNVAVADYMLRERVANQLIEAGGKPFSIKAANAVCLDKNEIGVGSVLCPFTTITSNVKVGKFFHGNLYSYIAHDCIIGDYVTFAPNVHCNGNVHIEDYSYIGTGAIIKQGSSENPIIIGKGSIIGMGAVVTKSVPPNTVMVGNPARPFLK